MFLAQIWMTTQLVIDKPIVIMGDREYTFRTVLASGPSGNPINTILIQSLEEREYDNEPEAAFRRLGEISSRLSFCLIEPLNIVAGRTIQYPAEIGQTINAIVYPSCPPGIALFEGKVGFGKDMIFDPYFLIQDLPKEIECAITWFINGNNALNAVDQVSCHWIGLESLAREVKGNWECPECSTVFKTCPSCGADTTIPKSVATIKNFLINELSVPKKEFTQLYELRCSLSHGAVPMTSDTIINAREYAFRVQELLLNGIKLRLGLNENSLPRIKNDGLTISGSLGMIIQFVLNDEKQYWEPIIGQMVSM